MTKEHYIARMIARIALSNSSKVLSRALKYNIPSAAGLPRLFSTEQEPLREGPRSHSHFRSFDKHRPTTFTADDHYDYAIGDHTGRQQNHIWSEEELNEKLSTLYRHKPVTIADHVMNKLVRCMYFYCTMSLLYSDVWHVPQL